MKGSDVEVVRLGGSLLFPSSPARASEPAMPSLRERLNAWRSARSTCRVWVAGTGAWGDALRERQAALALNDEACHWAAIRLMSAAAIATADLLGGAEIVRHWSDAREALRTGDARDVVFDSAEFLRDAEPSLPHDWSVTSDSIAARVAAAGSASLALVKSCPPPREFAPAAWSEAGLVDAFFPRALAPATEVSWIDLSRDPPVERRYAREP